MLSPGLLLMGFHNINILLSQHQTHWLQCPFAETALTLSVCASKWESERLMGWVHSVDHY